MSHLAKKIWFCASCSHENDSKVAACGACDADKEKWGACETYSFVNKDFVSTRGIPIPLKKWCCASCSYENDSKVTACGSCGADKEKWACKTYTPVNRVKDFACTRGKPIPLDKWFCTSCSYGNDSRASTCGACDDVRRR
jgi:hypothetical protein